MAIEAKSIGLTVIGLTSDPELLDRIISACPARNTVRGFSRIVCCEPKKSDEYYHVPVRDRAFLSLWTLLGGLIWLFWVAKLTGWLDKLTAHMLASGAPREEEKL